MGKILFLGGIDMEKRRKKTNVKSKNTTRKRKEIKTDPLGSYTGVAKGKNKKPEQDVDDLWFLQGLISKTPKLSGFFHFRFDVIFAYKSHCYGAGSLKTQREI